MSKETKKRIFLIAYIVFFILTILGAIYSIMQNKNAGYAVIPMLFGITFSMLYRNTKKEIEDTAISNKKK